MSNFTFVPSTFPVTFPEFRGLTQAEFELTPMAIIDSIGLPEFELTQVQLAAMPTGFSEKFKKVRIGRTVWNVYHTCNCDYASLIQALANMFPATDLRVDLKWAGFGGTLLGEQTGWTTEIPNLLYYNTDRTICAYNEYPTVLSGRKFSENNLVSRLPKTLLADEYNYRRHLFSATYSECGSYSLEKKLFCTGSNVQSVAQQARKEMEEMLENLQPFAVSNQNWWNLIVGQCRRAVAEITEIAGKFLAVVHYWANPFYPERFDRSTRAEKECSSRAEAVCAIDEMRLPCQETVLKVDGKHWVFPRKATPAVLLPAGSFWRTAKNSKSRSDVAGLTLPGVADCPFQWTVRAIPPADFTQRAAEILSETPVEKWVSVSGVAVPVEVPSAKPVPPAVEARLTQNALDILEHCRDAAGVPKAGGKNWGQLPKSAVAQGVSENGRVLVNGQWFSGAPEWLVKPLKENRECVVFLSNGAPVPPTDFGETPKLLKLREAYGPLAVVPSMVTH